MDPIADTLNRIKNAQKVGREVIEIPFSKVKFELAKIMEREEFLEKVEKKGIKTKQVLVLKLKYRQGVPAIDDLRRLSKPSRRLYIGFAEIKPVKQGYGVAIISTSRGLMTDKEARKAGLGGELVCEIW
ncbi:MAG: ribosomal protein S8 [Parcubacteria group bacterium LiPW_39]|nr:MAG: ribosomal protein S8 [Parcubacteria group bacterium LiPW_39]